MPAKWSPFQNCLNKAYTIFVAIFVVTNKFLISGTIRAEIGPPSRKL